jgi:hypothetical protein
MSAATNSGHPETHSRDDFFNTLSQKASFKSKYCKENRT